jgi:hypothetical protein
MKTAVRAIVTLILMASAACATVKWKASVEAEKVLEVPQQ